MTETLPLHIEIVTDTSGDLVIGSDVRIATEEEIALARQLHAAGKPCHSMERGGWSIIKDTAGWMYDTRECAICGAGLGTV